MTDKITLEEKLKEKLERGEIEPEEYEKLMKKFRDLDLLGSHVGRQRKKSYSFSGSRTMDGGEIAEPVRVSGKLRVTDSLICPSFSVSGSASIDGNLTVTNSTKVSGSLSVHGETKLGGNFKLSGKAVIDDSIYLTEPTKVSGKLEVTNKIVTSGNLKVSGKIRAEEFHSTNLVKLSGKISIEDDFDAEEFITSGGRSTIGGNLRARNIEIAKRYRKFATGSDNSNSFEEDAEDLETISDLGKFVSSMVTQFIPKIITGATSGYYKKPGIFSVGGNIEGEKIDITCTKVGGDVIGDDIILGPDVTVEGVIKYRNSVTVPDESNYTIVQLNN